MATNPNQNFLFCNASVFTGVPGDAVEKRCVLVQEDKISFVGPHESLDPGLAQGAQEIDIRGLTLMPGLIDSHLHFWGARSLDYLHRAAAPDKLNVIRAVKDAEALLEAGFTTVRDAGSNKGVYLKKAREEGTVLIPRVLTSHKVLCITGGHYDLQFFPLDYTRTLDANFRLADGPDVCRLAVREQMREGADFIKICTTGGIMSKGGDPDLYQFNKAELSAIVEEARSHGTYVSAHAYGREGMKRAILAGVRTIEHGTYIDDGVAQEMAARDIWLIPTLSIIHKIAHEGRTMGMSPWAVKKAGELNPFTMKALEIARRNGVPIASGTDFSGCPPMRHGENALELSLLVDAGMTPGEALIAATRGAAQALGIGDLTGTVEPGKAADLIAIEGDPLTDIGVLRKKQAISMVMSQGVFAVNKLEW